MNRTFQCFVFSATSIVRSRPLRENPIPVAREKSISHSSTSSNEENLLSSGSKSSAAANLVDPYALISKTSASEFRKNNDSISSNTTNEDIDEDEDFNYCDSNEQQVRKNSSTFYRNYQHSLYKTCKIQSFPFFF